MMQFTSPEFNNNSRIPSEYTCDGKDINPPLEISGVPQGAKSLVIIMDDPDVPKHLRADGMWDHWIKFNIPPTIIKIVAGEEPKGVSGLGTSGNLQYHGPCPPDREHRYFFKLYALDSNLSLSEGVIKKEVEKAIKGHILEQAVLVGVYERKI